MTSPVALRKLTPARAAAKVADESTQEWAVAFLAELERRVRVNPLDRVMATWDISAAGAGRIFGVSRQAVAKWLAHGVPEERAVAIADLAAATDVLLRYVKADRIPAVVRRPSQRLGGVSLLDVAEAGRYAEVRTQVTELFDLRRLVP